MKYISHLLLAAILLASSSLSAQENSWKETRQIEMTPDELKSIIRKLAEVRRQRYLMQQQLFIRTQQEKGAGTQVQRKQEMPASQPTIAYTDLADLRQRMDTQEALLRELLAQYPAPSVYSPPTTSETAMPSRTDTIIQRIIADPAAGQLDRQNLDALAAELRNMNAELLDLRRQLAYEERLRQQNERTSTTNAERMYEREASERFSREMRERQRELDRLRYLDRQQNSATAVNPAVTTPPAEVRIIRDTVYIDRVSTTPVFIPTQGQPDTVTIVKEIIREVPAEPVVRTETVVRDREVVRTDTLKLKATEPINFTTIFFDNNSSQLNATHRSLLANVADQVRGMTGYVIRLTGFASPSGNAAHNQRLSANRAAAVRQGLEALGVSGQLISLAAGGIDFQPTNAAAARRVEVQAIPR